MFIASFNHYIHSSPKTSAFQKHTDTHSSSNASSFNTHLEYKSVQKNTSQFATKVYKDTTFFQAKLLQKENSQSMVFQQNKKKYDAKILYNEAPISYPHAKKNQLVLGASSTTNTQNELGKLQEKFLYKEMVDIYRQNDRYYQRSA